MRAIVRPRITCWSLVISNAKRDSTPLHAIKAISVSDSVQASIQGYKARGGAGVPTRFFGWGGEAAPENDGAQNRKPIFAFYSPEIWSVIF